VPGRGRADNAEHDAHDRAARLVEHVLAQFAAQLARADVERLADRRTVAIQEKGDEQDQRHLQQAIGRNAAERQRQLAGRGDQLLDGRIELLAVAGQSVPVGVDFAAHQRQAAQPAGGLAGSPARHRA
jgi:hypothetical protein